MLLVVDLLWTVGRCCCLCADLWAGDRFQSWRQRNGPLRRPGGSCAVVRWPSMRNSIHVRSGTRELFEGFSGALSFRSGAVVLLGVGGVRFSAISAVPGLD